MPIYGVPLYGNIIKVPNYGSSIMVRVQIGSHHHNFDLKIPFQKKNHSIFFRVRLIFSNCPPRSRRQSLFLLKDIYVTSLPGLTPAALAPPPVASSFEKIMRSLTQSFSFLDLFTFTRNVLSNGPNLMTTFNSSLLSVHIDVSNFSR